MAKIMVVAGGEWQCPIVKTAKRMGHYVLCSNLYEDSPAFRYSDESVVVDVLDKERHLKIAEQYQPDVILTDQSDIAVPTVAYVAEKMGLKGIGTDKARLFTNKYAMRDFCRAHGFPTPRYRLCHTSREAEDFLKQIKKAILKPLDSQSSRGIHIVESQEQIRQYFADTLQYSNSEKAILIEQYIEGREFTVDGLKTADSYYVTAVSKKEHFIHNPSIAKELLFSNYDSEYDYDALRRLNTEIVLEMGLPFGQTHAEYKYMDGVFYLIEIAARGGGTKISSDLVPIMSGINSNEAYINTLFGKEERLQIHYDKNRYAVLGFFDLRPGKVISVRGLEEARHMEGIREIGLDLHAGSSILQASDDRSRAGYYIICADSYEELRSRETVMKNAIKIQYEGDSHGNT
ncbi:MAG: ATP-grasp domain-containing protein [Lachnospiraceae bacterium]